MIEKELNKKLAQAKRHRKYGEYAEAIALLHQIVGVYPEALYFYLLGGTYYEAGEDDLALEYLNKAIELKPDYKEAYEFKATIYANKKEYTDAEKMYLKTLAIDPDYIDARDALVELYSIQNKYEKVIEQSEIVFERQNIYGFTKEEFKEKDPWLMRFYALAESSYLKLKRYDEYTKLAYRYKYVMDNYLEGDDKMPFINEYMILYKLCFLKKDKKELGQLTTKIREQYNLSDKFLDSMKKDAEEGYIDKMNFNNYEINSDGTPV